MSTTNPTARPEAQEPWVILNWYRNQWWAGYEMGLTSDIETAGRYPEEFARRHAESSPYLRAVPLSAALRDGPPVEALGTIRPVEVLPGDESEVDLSGMFWRECPDCGCYECLKKREGHLPITERAGLNRLILCPHCGNKRCPRAESHHHACTGSNEPGQVPTPVEAQEPKPGEKWRSRDSGLEVEVVEVAGDCGQRRVVYGRPEWPEWPERLEMSLALWSSHYVRVETPTWQHPVHRGEPRPIPGNVKFRVATPTPDGWSVAGPVPLPSVEPAPPDYQADVRAFHEALVPDQVADRPTMPSEQVLKLRRKLIREECNELIDALEDRDMVRAVDGAGDAIWVILGTMVAMGVDLAPAWREIQRSNMAKEGGPMRADGKLLKPEGWVPPDVRGELIRQGWTDDGRGGEPPNGEVGDE